MDKILIRSTIVFAPINHNFSYTVHYKHTCFQYFPAAFAREARLENKKFIYLISPYSGKKWKMEVCSNAVGRISIGRGWSCFRDENNVKTGDTYTFTLVQDEDNNNIICLLSKKLSR